jgi:uncharacterized membrane protein
VSKGRLEAFSDGVIAILITIMVLGLVPPRGADLAALQPLIPTFLSYVLSFVFVGIYWVNHHHLFQIARHVNGQVLWANLHLLFWLSLVPFVTGWSNETHFAALPVAIYGVVLFMAGTSYYILERVLIAHHPRNSSLAQAMGKDVKGMVSMLIYLVAIALTLLNPWLSCGLYVLVAVMWFIPDPRIERTVPEDR